MWAGVPALYTHTAEQSPAHTHVGGTDGAWGLLLLYNLDGIHHCQGWPVNYCSSSGDCTPKKVLHHLGGVESSPMFFQKQFPQWPSVNEFLGRQQRQCLGFRWGAPWRTPLLAWIFTSCCLQQSRRTSFLFQVGISKIWLQCGIIWMKYGWSTGT